MSKRQWLMVFGVIIALIPFLGVPSDWKKIIGGIVGLLVIVIAYTLRSNEGEPQDSKPMPFIEHKSTADIISKSNSQEG